MKLIDMEKVLSELCLSHKDIIYIDKNETAERIRKIPSIDIVRCKECKHAHMTYGGDCKYCDMWKDDDDGCIELYLDGDFLKAKGTTLGADNGIAVAMILSILESDDISHPEIEAVFTTEEETGMLGATALDMSKLNAKRMINLDSESEGEVWLLSSWEMKPFDNSHRSAISS